MADEARLLRYDRVGYIKSTVDVGRSGSEEFFADVDLECGALSHLSSIAVSSQICCGKVDASFILDIVVVQRVRVEEVEGDAFSVQGMLGEPLLVSRSDPEIPPSAPAPPS